MLEATQRVGRYVLQERLGRGAVTEVWKGFDPHLERDIVLRLLPRTSRTQPDLIQRFLREARTMADLHHPNIVQVYDVAELAPEESDGVAACMVTSCIQSTTLTDYIARTSRAGRFPDPVQIVQLFTALGSAIDYAHRQGMIHGNIKPSNILLNQIVNPQPPGLPVLTDFGFARLGSAGANREHDISIVVGSPLYVAPELARGGAPTQAGDLYALGVILYELCTGKHPFASLEQRPLTLLFQKITTAPTPPSHVRPGISPALEAVILRGIAGDPGQRFPSALEMMRALAQALSVPLSRMSFVEYYALCPAPALTPEPVAIEAKDEKAIVRESAPTQDAAPHKEHDRGRRPPEKVVSSPSEKDIGRLLAARPPERARPRFASLVPSLRAPWFIPVCIMAFVAIAGLLFLSSGANQLLSHGQTASSALVGQALFMSSGQGDIMNGQGINDVVSLDLTHLAEPDAGKAYFAWLQADLDRSDSPVVLLGQLHVSQGSAHLTYADPQHTDLLATMSRILVTEEESGAPPIVPSPDRTTWKYAGMISQTPNPTDQHHYSLLDHLRHLLAADPELEALGLHDGLSFWFNHNSALIQQYAQSTRGSFEAKDTARLHQQLVSLLDYLDGIKDVGRDVPAGTPVFADATAAQVGLLQLHADQNPPSYLYHIGLHLSGLLASPGATMDQRKIATSVVQALDRVSSLLEQIRSIASQLVALPSNHLLQPQVGAQLATLAQLATTAYTGQGPAREGISWIHSQLATLALIPITTYQAS